MIDNNDNQGRRSLSMIVYCFCERNNKRLKYVPECVEWESQKEAQSAPKLCQQGSLIIEVLLCLHSQLIIDHEKLVTFESKLSQEVIREKTNRRSQLGSSSNRK